MVNPCAPGLPKWDGSPTSNPGNYRTNSSPAKWCELLRDLLLHTKQSLLRPAEGTKCRMSPGNGLLSSTAASSDST